MAAIVPTDEPARGCGLRHAFAPRRVTTQPTVPDDGMDLDMDRVLVAWRRRLPLATGRTDEQNGWGRQAGSRTGSSVRAVVDELGLARRCLRMCRSRPGGPGNAAWCRRAAPYHMCSTKSPELIASRYGQLGTSKKLKLCCCFRRKRAFLSARARVHTSCQL
jgi:ribosomal protein S14